MNKTELTQVLDLHAKWLKGEKEGKRADLSGAVLSGAVLSGADLSGAVLSGAVFPHRIISFGPFVTVRQMTIFDTKYDKVWSGCWTGTLAAFELKVREVFPDESSEHRQLFDAGIGMCKVAVAHNPKTAPTPAPEA